MKRESSVTRTLSTETPNVGLEGAIYRGLDQLSQRLLGRAWSRTEGAPLFIEQCLIDANCGQSTEVVYRFCRQGISGADPPQSRAIRGGFQQTVQRV